ncbi:unnamed protein product [Protopolystoma xenopodis]|uniref:Uncharacterized protein n=1 Tax=Protopolystoma xenopodis TaxID=117903 RepID=A0A3S5CP19_9PLAT|nr:unnamed protein product [Protopolystoma xenopodis]
MKTVLSNVDLFPLEEEEDEAALYSRLSAARATALPIVRDAIKASRACVLLLTVKQYLKDVYGITDA